MNYNISVFQRLFVESTSPKVPRKAESIEEARLQNLKDWHNRLSSDHCLSLPLPFSPEIFFNPSEPKSPKERNCPNSARRSYNSNYISNYKARKMAHSERSFIPQVSLPIEGPSYDFLSQNSMMHSRSIIIPNSARNSNKGIFRKTTVFPTPKKKKVFQTEPENFRKTLP